jgi:exopolysaccharide biosynthesis polyprenyl glycosylphosphotransferase
MAPTSSSASSSAELQWLPGSAPRRLRLADIVGSLDGRRWSRLRLGVDVIVLYLASAAALLSAPQPQLGTAGFCVAAAFPILVLAMLHDRGSPDDRLAGSLLDTITSALGTVSLAAMVAIALDSVIGGSHPVTLAARLWVFAALDLALARTMLLALRRRARRAGILCKPTLIIGAGNVGEHLVRRLLADRRYGLRPVGFIDADPLPRPDTSGPNAVPVLGGPDDLADAIERTAATHVILAFSGAPDYVLVEKVRECEKLGVEVSLVPRLYELINERATLDHVGGLPLVSLHSVDPRGRPFVLKHVLDRSLAFLFLLVLAPLLAAIAIAVRISSPGDVLFRQRRIGRDGHEFDILKFRTMRTAPARPSGYVPADGLAPGGIEGEDRRTSIGRLLRMTSLDELPQLINVLRADMSLVGPRPERPEYVARFVRDISRYEDRHRVKSGITGWAQVNGLRGQTSIADRVEWDNFYIQNWSIGFDLRILALTFIEVLRARKNA